MPPARKEWAGIANASFAPDRRQNHSTGWLIIKRAVTDDSLSITVGSDRPGDVRKRALAELADQNAGRIDRPRHDGPSLGNSLETVPPVIGLIAHQDDQPVAFGLGFGQRPRDQRPTDAARAERRLDRERTEQQRLGLA